jgi:hypothetical protein
MAPGLDSITEGVVKTDYRFPVARAGGATVRSMSEQRPTHEALARRHAEGFVAACSCGWIGRVRAGRRAASRDAREHEETAPLRELRQAAKGSDQERSQPV